MNNDSSSSLVDDSIVSGRNGSLSSIGFLLDRYKTYLLKIANDRLPPYISSKCSSSDIVQDTSYQAIRDFDKFNGSTEAELKAWLRQILLHNINDILSRYLDSNKRDVNRESNTSDLDTLKSSCLTPSTIAVSKELREAIWHAIERLPSDHRQIIVLRSFQGFSFAEIGEIVGATEEATRKAWVRTVLKLGKQFNNDQPRQPNNDFDRNCTNSISGPPIR